jgi:hypothetical protein
MNKVCVLKDDISLKCDLYKYETLTFSSIFLKIRRQEKERFDNKRDVHFVF